MMRLLCWIGLHRYEWRKAGERPFWGVPVLRPICKVCGKRSYG